MFSIIYKQQMGPPSYNLTARQTAVSIPQGLRNETLTFPSSTAAAWGSNTSFFIRASGGVLLHKADIQLQLGAVTGLTGSVTNYPAINPSYFMLNRVLILVNGVTVQDSIAPALGQYLLNNLTNNDEGRATVEGSGGSRTAIAQRNTMSTTSGTYWIIPLRLFFNETSFPILNQNHEVEVRVYFDQPSNFVAQSTLTGTPSIAIQSANLLCYVSRLPQEVVSKELMLLEKQPKHLRFHKEHYTQYTIASGSTSFNATLTNLIGRFDYLVFTLRATNAITATGAYTFLPITSYHLLTADGASMTGGNPVLSHQALSVNGRKNCRSSFLSEALLGTWNSYAYTWSPSTNPIDGLADGTMFTTQKFVGSEQLVLTFPSLASTTYVDVFAYRLDILEQSKSGISVGAQIVA